MNHEKWAREIVRLFSDRLHYVYERDAMEIKIAIALREAQASGRREGLEEAARVASETIRALGAKDANGN
jgi:hypothetical protein